MRLKGLWVLLVFPVMSSAFDATKVSPDVLIIKTRDAMNGWGGQDLMNSFTVSKVSKQITSMKATFPKLRNWGGDQGFPANKYLTVRLSKGTDLKAAIAEIQKFHSVESVEPDYYLSDPSLLVPNDPKVKNQWYLQRLKVPQAWKITIGEGVFVADVESGFDTSHPDLVNQFDLDKSHDYDPETNDEDEVNDNKRSHGTPVMGLIAAEGNNGLFGVGIAYGATLIGSQMANSMKVHSTESLWTVNSAKAILGSVERGANVVLIEKQLPSLLSSIERSKVIYDAIKAAVDRGVPVVVPAGNFYKELKEEAKLEDSGSIFVGATTTSDTPASFSNFGERLDVSAPGQSIYSIQQNKGETSSFGGTSSAAAITAGVVALVRAANPKLKPREIRALLKETGKKVSGKKVGNLLQAGPAVVAAVLIKPTRSRLVQRQSVGAALGDPIHLSQTRVSWWGHGE